MSTETPLYGINKTKVKMHPDNTVLVPHTLKGVPVYLVITKVNKDPNTNIEGHDCDLPMGFVSPDKNVPCPEYTVNDLMFAIAQILWCVNKKAGRSLGELRENQGKIPAIDQDRWSQIIQEIENG